MKRWSVGEKGNSRPSAVEERSPPSKPRLVCSRKEGPEGNRPILGANSASTRNGGPVYLTLDKVSSNIFFFSG